MENQRVKKYINEIRNDKKNSFLINTLTYQGVVNLKKRIANNSFSTEKVNICDDGEILFLAEDDEQMQQILLKFQQAVNNRYQYELGFRWTCHIDGIEKINGTLYMQCSTYGDNIIPKNIEQYFNLKIYGIDYIPAVGDICNAAT